MKAIEAYEQAVDKQTSDNRLKSEIEQVLKKLLVNNVGVDPTDNKLHRLVTALVKNGTLSVDDFE